MRKTAILFLFIIWTLMSFAQQQGNERFVRVVNRLIEAMNKQDYSGIVREYDGGMSAAFPLNKTTILFKNYESLYGKVNKVDPPQVKASDQAVYVLYFERGTQDLTLYIDGQEKIKGFMFTTHISPEPQPSQESNSVINPTTTQATNPILTVEKKLDPKQASAKTINSTEISDQKPPSTQTSGTTNPTLTAEKKIEQKQSLDKTTSSTAITEQKPPSTQTSVTTNPTLIVEKKIEPKQPIAKTTSSTAITEQKPSSTQISTTTRNPTGEAKTLQSTAPPPVAASTPAPAQPIAAVVPDKQKTELYPPFKGAWFVVTGGELREGTAQRNLLQQQYAYEFSAMDTNGLRYKNDGKANEDYNGYGKDVLSPANGTVVESIDGIRENSPGLRNPYAPVGNAIIIQHSNREYSVLAFLKQASVRVKVGDKVTRGQVIAQCGISGNATEPVIHYHLQDSPYLQTAKGIKFYFDRVMVTKEGKKELKLIHLPGVGETINSE